MSVTSAHSALGSAGSIPFRRTYASRRTRSNGLTGRKREQHSPQPLQSPV